MPQAPQSPEFTRRGRVTDVIGRFRATGLEACRAGARVAVRCSTSSGLVVIDVSEIAFVRAFRGEFDANHNPFRSLEQIHASEFDTRKTAPITPSSAPVLKPNGRIL